MARKPKGAIQTALETVFGDPESENPAVGTDGTLAEDVSSTVSEGVVGEPYILEGKVITLKLSEGVGENSFLVTSMIRGIASNLQYSRVSAEDKLTDMTDKVAAKIAANEATDPDHPEEVGMTDKQQMFADSLCTQLEYIEDLFVDLRTFWAEVNDNPEFKLLNRPDIAVRKSIKDAEARKAEAAVSTSKSGAKFDLSSIAARRANVAARRQA